MLSEPEIERTLLTAGEIKERVAELAREISGEYREGSVLLVGILKGAFVFLADLARKLEIPVEFDFMAVSSYGSMTRTSGVVRILKDLDTDIAGRKVLIVEDLIDTGLTLNYLLRNLNARGPESVEICALLNKRAANQVEVPIKYEGFSIPGVFVVGYGMDCAESYRNLPYIAVIKR